MLGWTGAGQYVLRYKPTAVLDADKKDKSRQQMPASSIA
jgi:hypothetical protein